MKIDGSTTRETPWEHHEAEEWKVPGMEFSLSVNSCLSSYHGNAFTEKLRSTYTRSTPCLEEWAHRISFSTKCNALHTEINQYVLLTGAWLYLMPTLYVAQAALTVQIHWDFKQPAVEYEAGPSSQLYKWDKRWEEQIPIWLLSLVHTPARPYFLFIIQFLSYQISYLKLGASKVKASLISKIHFES